MARIAGACVLILASVQAVARADETLPLEIHAGVIDTRAGTGSDSGGPPARQLPDLPFSAEREYGYIGGSLGRLPDQVVVVGARPDWPPSWREGIEKLVVRVPRGEYLVELSFLETEVALSAMRVFDVLAEEDVLFAQVDCAAAAGDFAWLTLRGVVSVFDGWLDLRFDGRTSAYPPRFSRLRLSASANAPSSSLLGALPSHPAAAAGPACVTLSWQPPDWPGVAGYGVFRANDPGGPFRSLTEAPVPVPWFEDRAVVAGERYAYKVRAYSVHGGQSPVSASVVAVPWRLDELALDTYELRVAPEDLRALAVRPAEDDAESEVPAQLLCAGAAYKVFLAAEAGADWGRKKTYRVTLDQEENRFFRDRRTLLLSAAPGDVTLMRDLLASRAAAAAGLAAPSVTPVALLINGRYLGLYHDVEVIDARFVRRARLDRSGLLASLRARELASDVGWRPLGDKIGNNGAVIDLNLFAHELGGVGEDEIASYCASNFYLDRFLTWRACVAASGERAVPLATLHALKDSRNGRWEFFRQRAGAGAWGGPELFADDCTWSEDDARAFVYGDAVQGTGRAGDGFAWLLSRAWNVRAVREAYLQRLAEILADALAPARFDRLVDETFSRIERAAAADPLVATTPPRFVESPRRLKDLHRRRADLLAGFLAAERARAPGPVVLSEVVFAGGGGAAIEVENLAARPVDLAGYAFSDALASGPGVRLPEIALGAGERRVFPLPANGRVRANPAGGVLALVQGGASDDGARVADFLVYARPTAGTSLARVAGEWASLSGSTPGGENRGEARVPPPYRYRQGVVRDREGRFTIWLQAGWSPGSGDAQAAVCALFYRGDEDADWRSVPLLWNDASYRHEVSLEAGSSRGRMAYYYQVRSPEGRERTYPLPAPAAAYTLPVLPPLVINEVLPRPRRESGMHEFIEIYNPAEDEVDLSGCFLSDRRGNPTRWRIPEGTVIGPRGFAVFYTARLNRENGTNFRLSNAGEFLGLFGRLEEGNLQIDGIAFRGMRPGESWGRSHDGAKGFRVWKDPTPGKPNLPRIPEEFLRPNASSP